MKHLSLLINKQPQRSIAYAEPGRPVASLRFCELHEFDVGNIEDAELLVVFVKRKAVQLVADELALNQIPFLVSRLVGKVLLFQSCVTPLRCGGRAAEFAAAERRRFSG